MGASGSSDGSSGADGSTTAGTTAAVDTSSGPASTSSATTDTSDGGPVDSTSTGSETSSSSDTSAGSSGSSGSGSSSGGGFDDACPHGDIDPDLPTLFGSNTAFANDDFAGSCGGAGLPDREYTFTAPAAGTYAFSTDGSLVDTVVYVLDGVCSGAELACNDNTAASTDSLIQLDLAEGQTVTLVIDTAAGAPGPFSVNVLSGSVACPQGEISNTLPASVTSSTEGHLDNLSASCGGADAPDNAFTFTAPATATYAIAAIDTTGFEVLYVLDGVCGGAELFCGDTTGGFIDLVEGQTVTIVVDGVCCGVTADLVQIDVSAVGGTCPDEIVDVPGAVVGDTSSADNTTAGSCGGVPSPDTSYQFTAPADGFYAFSTVGSALDTVVYVRDGSCDGTEIGCSDDISSTSTDSRVTTRIGAGQTVVATVDGRNGAGAFALDIAEVPCIDTTLPQTVPQTIVDSSYEGFDRLAGSCADAGAPERTYAFTAPADGVYGFDTFGSSFDAAIYVLDGTSCDGSELACNGYASNSTMSPVTVALLAGQSVTIVVDGSFFYNYVEPQGDLVLNVNMLEGGACPDVDLGASVPVSVSGATDDPGDDDTVAGSCGGIATADDIYLFTAPAPGLYVVDTEGSAADTLLVLRASCDGPEIACNDDLSAGTSSLASTWLEADEPLFVAVDANTPGAYELHIDAAVCPSSDLGSTVPLSIEGSTDGADDLLVATGCFDADLGSPEVTYGWTAPADGTYVFDLVGSNYDTFLLVQADHCAGDELACNDDTFDLISQVTVDLTAGQFVAVSVSGFDGETGDFVLNISQP